MTRNVAIVLVVAAALAGVIYWSTLEENPASELPETLPEPSLPEPDPARTLPVAEPAKGSGGARVTGDVLAETGEPGRGAEIRLVALDAKSWPRPGEPVMTGKADRRGRFSIGEVPAGLYRVEARSGKALGYVPLLRVRDDVATRVRIRLESLVEIRGFVLSEDGGPIGDATVSADLGGVSRAIVNATGTENRMFTEPLSVRTDEYGAFRLTDLPRGQYEIEVEAEGHRESRIRSVNAPVDDVEIRLFRTWELDGTVSWAGRSSIETIRITGGGGEVVLKDRSSPAPFTFGGLTRGRYLFRIVADGYAAVETEVVIEAGRRAGPLRIRLGSGATISGSVTSRKRFVSGYRLVFFRVEGDRREIRLEEILSVAVDDHGRYTADLAPGRWVARLRSPNGVEHRSSSRVEREIFEVEKNATQHFRFTIYGVVRGRVRYEDGWSAGGIRVRGRRSDTETDTAGTFELRGLELERESEISFTDGLATVKKIVKLTRIQPGADVEVRLPRLGRCVVRGQVISEEDQPIAGATVLFEDGFAITDPDGRFVRRDVRPGRNSLRFYAPGYSMGLTKPFVVTNEAITEPKLLILPWHPARVTGHVCDLRGDPIPGALVRILFSELGQEFETSTDPTGRFRREAPGAIGERAILRVSARGYRPSTRSVRVQPDVEEAEFRLSPARVSK